VVNANHPLISVVVPTRDRPEALKRCLDALDAQTVAAQLEVVVVDDGSVEGAVSSVVGRHPCARSIRQGGAGPAAARNAGAREALGSVLCFTDDDCVPGRAWVERLADALHAGGGAVCGRTIPHGGVLADASELIAHAPAGPASGDTHEVVFAPSNNLACTKAVFDATPFDESYPDAAGEDREWCARLIASGHRLRYVPSALLEHHQSLTMRRFLEQQVRYGEGAFRYRRGGSVDRPLEPPSFYAALVRRAFRQGLTVGLLVCVAQGATAVGFIRGWASRRRHGSSFVT
jgi:glycosyltransferase involved in cell wall biosynthesis